MAFDFIPGSRDELVALAVEDNRFKAHLEFYDFIVWLFPNIEKPIALDPSGHPSSVKYLRSLDGSFDLDSFEQKTPGRKISINAGDGSRGGKGCNNAGIQFESLFKESLEDWLTTGSCSNKIHLKMLNEFGRLASLFPPFINWSVIDESTNNSVPRDLKVTHDLVRLGESDDIGHVLTDLTAIINAIKYYMSLKHGHSYNYANIGIKQLFAEEDVKSGNYSIDAKRFFNFFGVEAKRFSDVFNHYGTNVGDTIDVTDIADHEVIAKFIRSSIGYGYFMMHLKSAKTQHVINMTRDSLQKLPGKIQNVSVRYGGARGMAKHVDVIITTDIDKYKISIRNTNGKVYPTMLQVK